MKFFSKKNLAFLKNNIQVVYGVVLLLLIPGALILNTMVFFDRAAKVMDTELLRKAALADDVIATSVPDLLSDRPALQAKVTAVAEANDEVYSLDVLVPNGDAYTIVASLDPKVIGQDSNWIYNTLAWQRNTSMAFTTSSNAKSTEDESSQTTDRYWVVVKPVSDALGQKVALVSVKLSSKIIDDLSRQLFNRSLIVLIASILVIVLLLINNTKLFQYATLANKLREVDQMKDEFISMTSHELRAPITGIRGYLAMIGDGSFGQLPPDAHDKVQLVLTETNRLRDLVEDLLDVSRIEQDRIKLDILSIPVKSIFENMVNTFCRQAEGKKLKLLAELPDQSVNVLADYNKLTQIMVNLVSNAIKYTPQGSVTISATRTDDKRPMVKIKVTDTGMGMSAKNREKLFQKFYRIRNEQTDKIIGTGLGLWITKALVMRMKGEIYVDSIEGKGTEFTVLLPAAGDTKPS
ncbi:MAG: HAMP domain-containing sensor histidine kinase [Patescibacteria group bacterium]